MGSCLVANGLAYVSVTGGEFDEFGDISSKCGSKLDWTTAISMESGDKLLSCGSLDMSNFIDLSRCSKEVFRAKVRRRSRTSCGYDAADSAPALASITPRR